MGYSKQQTKVIDTRDKDILVPASAGSGKTTVLVARVLEILSENPQMNIDDFLLMTFTKDAAKHMRDKIQQALLNSKEQRLRNQAERVAMADISTIHAFCQEIIRRYYYVIELDPQYRLMSDETEIILLQNQAWDEAREEEYAADESVKDISQRHFDQLVANFAGDRNDDQLYDIVHDLYDEAIAKPNPQQWLDSLAAAYQLDGDDASDWSFFQQYLKPQMLGDLTSAQQKLAGLAQAGGKTAFGDQLATDAETVGKVISAVEAGQWETIRALIASSFPTARSGTRDKESEEYQLYQELKPQRDEIKQRVKSWGDYFNLSQKQVVHFSAIATKLVTKLAEVVKNFMAHYQQIKLDRHLLDFADLEHYAYQIMTTDSDEGHRAQQELRYRYREIMVDEYQDTNKLQDAILNCLKNDGYNHLFMVGDVKQAIYRFRQADPTIFRRRDQEFIDQQKLGVSIPLAKNFRSGQTVVAFINGLFKQLMDQQLGDVDYDQNAQLEFGASWYEKAKKHPVELMLYSANHAPEGKKLSVEEPDKMTGEVRMIAMRIKELVNKETIYDSAMGQERPIKYSDIAILTRTKGINNAVVEQFGLEDIPVAMADVKNFFASTEVRLMLDLLSLLDNPYQDIPLVAVLRSPMVGMTEPEMAYLRLVNRNIPYYQALVNYQFNKDKHIELPVTADEAGVDLQELEEKVDTFLDQLKRWRTLAQRQSLVKLIWTIYQETGYLDYVGAMPGGDQRQANLHALYQRADDYEQRGYQGVYQFVRFIRQLQKQDKDIGQAARQTADNAVSVMTIHGSKGLEFPIVFLADTNRKFKDDTSSVVIDADAGIGISVVEQRPAANDEDEHPVKDISDLLSGIQVRYRLPQRRLISDQIKLAGRAEELRILYVALTRAEQWLIITGSVNDCQPREISKLVNQVRTVATDKQELLPVTTRLKASSYLSWILMALVRYEAFPDTIFGQSLDVEQHQDGQPSFVVNEFDLSAVNKHFAKLKPSQQRDQQPDQSPEPQLADGERKWINDILTFNYQHSAATKATAFQAVSMVRELVKTDPDTLEMGRLTFNKEKAQDSWDAVDALATPRFVQGTNRRPSRAVVGTATHLVFQKLPLDRPITAAVVQQEVDRLVDQWLIPSQEVADEVDTAGIAAFYQTVVGQQLLADPANVHREQQFSMIIPASDLNAQLTKDDGQILVHGIIDGLQYCQDGITLFDYKTDQRHRGESQEDFEQRMLDHYAGQLTLYADALNKMGAQSGRGRVVRQYLYLVATRTLLPTPLLK